MTDSCNFNNVRVLLAHGNQTIANLHESLLRGFGVREITVARNAGSLRATLHAGPVDLILIDNSIGANLIPVIIREIRSGKTAIEQDTAILLSYCHSNFRNVLEFRDSGTNMVMSLPFTVKGIYERLVWIATKPREFIVSETYRGPCRRVSPATGPNNLGRRKSDQPEADVELDDEASVT